MSQIKLSDGQSVESESIEKAELFGNNLLITTKPGQIKVHGASVEHDADLLDEIRDREHLNYGVFRKKNSK